MPGDLVTLKTPKGYHSVLFAGLNSNGRPRFIGSNNDNPDGTQRISIARFDLPIVAIQHYVG